MASKTLDPFLLKGDIRKAHPPKPIKVFCDGAPLPSCFAFNVEEGWAAILTLSPDGKPQLNESQTDVLREKVTGKIEARYVDQTSPAL
jgi:hypothetical protein